MSARDRIFIRGLTYHICIGVYSSEQERPQEVTVDLDMAVDVGPAARSDRLSDAVDYERVCRRTEAVVSGYKGKLVEGLCEQVAMAILADFAVEEVTVRVSKPAVLPEAKAFAVEVVRRAG